MKYLYLLLCFIITPQNALAQEKPERLWSINSEKITKPQPEPPLILNTRSYQYRGLRTAYIKSNPYYQMYKSQILHKSHFCTCESCCPPIRRDSTGIEWPPYAINGFHYFYLRL